MEKEFLEDLRCELSIIIEKIDTALEVKPILLTTEIAAKCLHLSEGYLIQMRKGLRGPKYLKISGAIRYQLKDLEDWAKSQPRHG